MLLDVGSHDHRIQLLELEASRLAAIEKLPHRFGIVAPRMPVADCAVKHSRNR
jgi:hypothetical protein